MAKLKYQTKGVERGGGAAPKPGVYRCKLISCDDATPEGKNRRLEPVYEIMEGDSKGFKLYDYIPLIDSMDWKLAQFVDAMGLPENGTMDLEKIIGTGLNVRTTLKNSEEWGAQAKPATLMALDGDEDDEDLSGDDDDAGDDDADDGDGDDETYTEEELMELEKADLFEVADEYELEKPGKLTAAAKKRLVAAILEAQGGDEDEDEDGDDEDGDDELWTEEELTELDDDDLGEQAGEFELELSDFQKTTGKGKAKKTKLDRDGLIEAILEAQGEDEDGDGDEDDAPDYEAMELADLKALCKEKSLSTKGTKKVLIARLEKDDEPF